MRVALAALILFWGCLAVVGSDATGDSELCGGRIADNHVFVLRAESVCQWPFDVDSMQIGCDGWGPEAGELYFVSELGRFGLNGSGKARFGDPRAIWLDSDRASGGKVSVQPWINVGLGLCH